MIVDNLMNLEMLFWAAIARRRQRVVPRSPSVMRSRRRGRTCATTAAPRTSRCSIRRRARSSARSRGRATPTARRGRADRRGRFTASPRRTVTRNDRSCSPRRSERRTGSSRICRRTPCRTGTFVIRQSRTRSATRRPRRSRRRGSTISRGTATPAARDRYRATADRILASLASNYVAPPSPRGAILAHSTGALPFKSEVDVGIVYADYFFVEALLRQKGLFAE